MFGGNREHTLRALRLNQQILHSWRPDADADKAGVHDTIDDLLDQPCSTRENV